jgi:hypothetical protein
MELTLNESKVNDMHAKIDAEAKEQINLYTAQVKDAARKKHESLDEWWRLLQELGQGKAEPPVNVSSPDRPSFSLTGSNASSNGGHRKFQTQDAITDIINDLDVTADITQPFIYKVLLEKHGEAIKGRDQKILRGQIPAILNNLVKKGKLEPPFKEFGSKLNVYRKKVLLG